MFTGLIEERGSVKKSSRNSDGIVLDIYSSIVIKDAEIGDSIAINGACQTITGLAADYFTVFVSGVTASLTTLGRFKPGREVNLERAMRPLSRFGGHIVQGHVDGKGKIVNIRKDRSGIEFEIDVTKDIHKYIVERGSVTVDGISLTVVKLTESGFIIYIIPETIKKTIIGQWAAGDYVNIEVDILAKYVERMLLLKEGINSGVKTSLKEKLLEEGFI